VIKRILHILSAILLLIYLVFSVAFINPKAEGDKRCKGIKIEVAENGGDFYLNRMQIENLLKRSNIKLTGLEMAKINAGSIEKTLKEYKLIKKAEVYKTIDGTVNIRVYQRKPILRVISERENYYIDDEGQRMPVPPNYAALAPLATGAISEEYAKNQLYRFAEFLCKNKFWNRQIEQIHVLPNLDIELTPCKGNHIIVLGKVENYRENLEKLKVFYDKGLNKVGWNKYSRINLKYKDQVVCTKKE
jgi:cell division protein FtsQ